MVTFVKDATCLTNKKGNYQLKLRAGVGTLCPGCGSPLLFLDRVWTGHDRAFLNDCHHPVTKTLGPIKTEVPLPEPSQRSADSDSEETAFRFHRSSRMTSSGSSDSSLRCPASLPWRNVPGSMSLLLPASVCWAVPQGTDILHLIYLFTS